MPDEGSAFSGLDEEGREDADGQNGSSDKVQLSEPIALLSVG